MPYKYKVFIFKFILARLSQIYSDKKKTGQMAKLREGFEDHEYIYIGSIATKRKFYGTNHVVA
ncbi:MAG: hypothetical protein AUJ12_00810 [Alphaproteobacteria bacterium CG1_02_46_17]|nr:MAG: hypothetical protein AUJ12_00810 [Alphaproteobacteria bacterium CG1_02_46_17]